MHSTALQLDRKKISSQNATTHGCYSNTRILAGESDLIKNFGDPVGWEPEQHKELERFLRYRTTAERRFHRFRNMVEQTRKSRQLEEHRRQMLAWALAKEARLSQKPPAHSSRPASPPPPCGLRADIAYASKRANRTAAPHRSLETASETTSAFSQRT